MKGLVLAGVERIEYDTDLPEPRLEQPTDVIVAVRRAGICGSDLHPYFGRESIAWGTIPGHEFAGEVVAAGAEVSRFRVGDLVFSPFTTSCGKCFHCQDGLSARCEHSELFGYRPVETTAASAEGLQGAQAELVRVPLADSTLLELPDYLSLDDAVLLGDNFTTGYYCASLGEIRSDGLTVVIGCGSVGLSAVVAARSMGAAQIVAVDPVADRRHRAAELGADACAPEEAVDFVLDSSSGRTRAGADSVLEAVGSPAAQQLAFALVRPGGVISAIGVHTAEQFAFSPTAAYDKNLTYRAGRCPVRSVLAELMPQIESGRLAIPTKQVITHRSVPLQEGQRAYEQFSTRAENCVKILLDPT